jgi:hypothetical protein
MSRLNLTLDDDTVVRIARHARHSKKPRAAVARDLIREGLDERDARERRRRLAADYAAGRSEARLLLTDLEVPQLDLLAEDEWQPARER